MRQTNMELFGEDTISMTDEMLGLDEEGELKGSYRPSGYPGASITTIFFHTSGDLQAGTIKLWYATGDFFISRCMSKTLVSVSPLVHG